MPNQSGNVYGLTVLSPIINGAAGDVSHDCAIRDYLSNLPRDQRSPFAKVSSTHLARLVVMDDVVFVGTPAREEHLQSKYLVFETNFDGDLDTYLTRMAREAAEEVHAVWQHCVGYPGVQDPAVFAAYLKKCQVETTFFFADVNNKTVQQTLRALKVQSGLAHFIETNQGKSAGEIQAAFRGFLEKVRHAPGPPAGEDGGHPHG
ncbi:MAG: hypothetical protein ABSC05_23065 [Candidatus Solibacter sp.]|jgi:hypothetical protein